MNTTAVATVEPRRSITVDMAARFGMEPSAFEQTLRATVLPGNASKEEFAAFLMVAREYKLNPITREIYAFPKKGGGIQPVVSVDGWANIINSHPAFNGLTFIDHLDDKGLLVSITCRVWRKDRDHPIEATEYLAECRRGGDVWNTWPRRMLRHKAMIQAARYAFGFAGIIDHDEAERFTSAPPQARRPSLAKALELAATPRPQEPQPGPVPIPPQGEPEEDTGDEEDDDQALGGFEGNDFAEKKDGELPPEVKRTLAEGGGGVA